MTFATAFLAGSFILTCLVSFYYFLTMNDMPRERTDTAQQKFDALGKFVGSWKLSLLIWVILLILYFIYYGALMVSMIDVTNIYNSGGGIDFQIQNEDYRLGWEFLKIMIALMYINTGVLIWRIFNQTQLLVKVMGTRFKQKKTKSYSEYG